MSLHTWLNALHIIAGMLWVFGMLLMAFTYTVTAPNPQGNAAMLAGVRRWSARVTSPSMIVLWAAGITMMVTYGQFPHAWLVLKIVVVVALSALHGLLSGALRRLASGEGARFPWLRRTPALLIAAVIVIIVLAIIRPF
ncbi:CopD family protein [Franconibacter helveticus 513]|uniref:CopD family protein n=1 Tax=Franconibacter helveticus TaxID=357240 RepID=UPI0004187CE2|nr:CopD family protein [Franconibacter helveticus]MDU6926271.1 CopD family protein [Franconibacter helveticus]